MTRYLLDTTVLVHFCRRVPSVRDRLLELVRAEHVLAICGINVTEFYSGIRPGANPAVDEFIDSLTYVEISREMFITAGDYRYRFSRQGHTLASPDTILAAVARHFKATLLTENVKHFPMEDITVERLGVKT